MRKWIVLIILGVIIHNYIYKDHRNIETESAVFELSSLDISNEFAINPTASEQKYINKTIELVGIVTEINENNLTLNNQIFCQFNSSSLNQLARVKSKIKIKGRVIGYDDLLEQIKLDQCIIIKQ